MAWTVAGERPRYCPWCGGLLDTQVREDREFPHCEDCERTLYRNPVPMARATVVDGDSVLLIERGEGADVGEWVLPGGHVDADESFELAAARELREETDLRVEPDDLSLLGTGFLEFEGGHTMASVNFAASAAVAAGTVEAGDDAAAARFWGREEIVEETPLLRASGVEQVLSAMDAHGDD